MPRIFEQCVAEIFVSQFSLSLFLCIGFSVLAVKTVIAIPAFNEEGTIAKVIVRARAHADKVLVVDDGSRDDTRLIAQALGAVVVVHEKNLGKGAALRDCFEWAKSAGAEVLVILDADGQHDPSNI